MKSFVIKALTFLTPLIALTLNYLLLNIRHEPSGDFGRMSCIFFEKGYHDRVCYNITSPNAATLTINDTFPDSIDVLLVGDSFSDDPRHSINSPMGDSLGITVYKYCDMPYAPLEVALSFLTYLPTQKMPKVLIVERIERCLVSDQDLMHFDCPTTLDSLRVRHSAMFGDASNISEVETQWHNNNKGLEKSMMQYYRRHIGIKTQCVASNLNKELFSSRGKEKKLYSYYYDTIHYPENRLHNTVQKLNQLHRLAKEKNVELLLLPIPNKSTIYAEYSDKKELFYCPLTQTIAFDTLPYVINITDLLKKQATNGMKDIYMSDDTHWSSATALAVGHYIAHYLAQTYRTSFTLTPPPDLQ